MEERNRLFRRLSLYFLLLALVSLLSMIIVLLLMASSHAFVCPPNDFWCYVTPDYSLYKSAIYGLGFSIVLSVLLSSLFSRQVESITEYSGYIKSISEHEREKLKEEAQPSAALKEYFLHMRTLEQEEKDKRSQLSMEELDLEENYDEETINQPEEIIEEKDIEAEKNEEIIEEEIIEEEIIEEEIIEEEIIEEEIINELTKEVIEEEVIAKEVIEEEVIAEEVIEDVIIDNRKDDIVITEEVVQSVKVLVPKKTKKDFERIIFEEGELNKTKSKLVLNSILKVLTEELAQGNIISIDGFGKFRKQTYKARDAVNPKTMEKIKVEEHSVARFYPNRKFKESINEKNKVNIDPKYARKVVKLKEIKEEKKIEVTTKNINRSKTLTKSNTKKDIILKIYDETYLSKNKSREFLNAFIYVVIESISNGKAIEIPTIGKLNIVTRAPKRAINPQTGEAINIPEHKALKMKFSKDFKLNINQKK